MNRRIRSGSGGNFHVPMVRYSSNLPLTLPIFERAGATQLPSRPAVPRLRSKTTIGNPQKISRETGTRIQQCERRNMMEQNKVWRPAASRPGPWYGGSREGGESSDSGFLSARARFPTARQNSERVRERECMDCSEARLCHDIAYLAVPCAVTGPSPPQQFSPRLHQGS